MTSRFVAASLALVALAAPSLAHAGAKEDLAEASRLLENVQEEKAVPLLTQAVENKDATPAERAELYGLLGVARFNLRDEAGAREAFRKALDADATLSVSKLLAPKGRALFEEVREAREKELAQSKPAEPVSAPAAAVEQPKKLAPSTRALVGLGVGAAGVVSVAIGAGLLGNAFSLHGKAVDEPDAMKADDLYRSGSTQRKAGIALTVVGAVMAAGGVVTCLLPEGLLLPGTPLKLSAGPGSLAVAGTF